MFSAAPNDCVPTCRVPQKRSLRKSVVIGGGGRIAGEDLGGKQVELLEEAFNQQTVGWDGLGGGGAGVAADDLPRGGFGGVGGGFKPLKGEGGLAGGVGGT